MDNARRKSLGNSSSVNDRPYFTQNGNGRYSNAVDSQEISNFRRVLPQFLAVSVKNVLLFGYGMTLGYPTIVIPAIQGGDGREPSDIVLNREEISWFSSINLITVPLGCLFSGLLTQPIGKRRAMQFVNLPILASWLLFHFSARIEHLYAALCLSGLGGGLMEAPVLTYVAEITEPKYRGILSALGSTCVITGVFVQFILGSLMDWRTIAAVCSACPVISIITLCFVPESPTWLIRKRRFREAVKALQWLRGWVPEHRIETEFNRLYEDLITKPALEEASENHGTKQPSRIAKFFKMFRKRSFLFPFLLVAYTFFTGHFSGKTPLQTYAVQIFHTLKAPINKYHATILLGVCELVATIMGVCLIHFTGKRPLVLVSTIGVGCCIFGTATYAHYLNVVPGFAINNVVVNASSIVPKNKIISQQNISKIFEIEEKNLLLSEDPLILYMNQSGLPGIDTTLLTLLGSGDIDEVTTGLQYMQLDEILNENQTSNIGRIKRIAPKIDSFTIDQNDGNGGDNLSFIDFSSLDYEDSNSSTKIKSKSTLESLLDSEEEFLTTTTMPLIEDVKHIISVKQAEPDSIIPTSKNVAEEILLPVPKQERNTLAWLPLILLLGSAFFAHIGIRMIPWILIGEVFPAPVRSTASGLVSGLGYIFGFLANKLFLQMLSALTLPGTFWLYSGVAFLGGIILYFILPETEGRTLAEIEAHFSKKSDTNLLSKSNKKSSEKPDELNLSSLQNLEVPINSQIEAKIIQLQQSDFVTGRSIQGESNPAFEENNTTHL